MRGRPGNRRASKGARKSTRSKASKSKSARSKSTRTKRAATRKTAKAPARKKVARKSAAGGRKAVAKKAAKKTTARKTARRSPGAPRKEVFGEGNYTASREFRRGQTNFVRRNRNKIPKLGEAAETALEGGEGRELEEAEDRGRSHSHSPDEEF